MRICCIVTVRINVRDDILVSNALLNVFFFYVIANENDWEKGLNLYKQMLEEEVEPSSQFLSTLAKLLRRYKQPIPFDAPNVEYESIAEEKEVRFFLYNPNT